MKTQSDSVLIALYQKGDEKSLSMLINRHQRELFSFIYYKRPFYKIIIENVQQQSGVSTVILLARLQGFILGFASAHNIPVEILGPSKWRSALGYKQGAGVKRKELTIIKNYQL